ncbi:MAG TPA: TetR/AcrR family transcriptional regulator, partial [Thermoleophilaceae bacterium]
CAVHREELMRSKVADDNIDVNDNIEPVGSGAMSVSARPYHHGNLRLELLDHAERALSDGGIRELSLRELARRAGVSHAAPRRHFSDKQALLDALAEDGFVRLGGELQDAMQAAGETFDARLGAFAHAYVRFATEHAALLELMFAVKHQPDADDTLRQAAEQAFAAPRELVTRAQAAGEIVAGDPERVAMVAFAALQGLASMINGGMVDEADRDALVADAVERLLLGLRPR